LKRKKTEIDRLYFFFVPRINQLASITQSQPCDVQACE
jgi:hypothetical protein